jgi:ribosome modulation factor
LPAKTDEIEDCRWGINCRRKDVCWFRHPDDKKIVDKKTVSANEAAKTDEIEDCRWGINCRRKDVCWFRHPDDKKIVNKKAVSDNETAKKSSVDEIEDCRWGINCRRKDVCWFRHPDDKKNVAVSDSESVNSESSNLDRDSDSDGVDEPEQRRVVVTGLDFDVVTKKLTFISEERQYYSDEIEAEMANNTMSNMESNLDEEDEEIIKLEEDYEEIAKCNRDHLCDKVESTDDLSKLEAIYSEIRKYLDILFPIGNPLPFCNHDNDKTINYIKNIVDIIELRGTPDEVFDFISKIIDDIIPDSDFTHRKE